jgi:D-inositol-3-phosphate glycosyltransferase
VSMTSISDKQLRPGTSHALALEIRAAAAGKDNRCRSTVTRADGREVSVALLTGGSDKHYVYGLSSALGPRGARIDLIGSDELDVPELRATPGINFINLRGDQRREANFLSKASRILRYYGRLIRYAAVSEMKVFHILWNNKFALFDRTILTLYYKLLGKKVILTAHNVNSGRRDGTDTNLSRLTLHIQYHLADRIFVHTDKMKSELVEEFGVTPSRVVVIPFGINNAVPRTNLTPAEAKRRLGIGDNHKAILFFGKIGPYKGLDQLLSAFHGNLAQQQDYRLIIAGSPRGGSEQYWRAIEEGVRKDERILVQAEFIPDRDIELYFKAADILVLPYRHIYQSGVLFLGYSFGLPVLAADVGSLRDEIIEGETGFVFRPDDPVDLATAIRRYFSSALFADLAARREKIENFATSRHSWDTIGDITMRVYSELLGAVPESSGSL